MNKKYIFIILLVFLVSGMVYADNKEQLNNVNSQIDKIRNEIEDKKEELSTLSKDILKTDEQIYTIENKIQSLNLQLKKTQDEIDLTSKQIDEKENEINNLNEALKDRIRVMSKINEFDYIQIMFSSKNLSDFLSNYTIINKIIKQDKDNLNKLEIAKIELNNVREEFNTMKKSLEILQEQYNTQNNNLQYAKKLQEDNLNKLKNDIVSLRQIEEKKIQEARKIEEEIKRLANAQNSYKGSYSGGKLEYPVAGGIITSYYGYRNHPILKSNIFHTGIDIAGNTGVPIIAAESGRVIYTGAKSTYGNTVLIDHGSNIVTLYAHCHTINVSVGQIVSRGQTIATVGSTGRSTGPHLHFEVRINGAFTDPLPYLK